MERESDYFCTDEVTSSASPSSSSSCESYKRNISFKNVRLHLSGRSSSSRKDLGFVGKYRCLSPLIALAGASRSDSWLRTAVLTTCSSVWGTCDGGCHGLSAAFRLRDCVTLTAVTSSRFGVCSCCDFAGPLYTTTASPRAGLFVTARTVHSRFLVRWQSQYVRLPRSHYRT